MHRINFRGKKPRNGPGFFVLLEAGVEKGSHLSRQPAPIFWLWPRGGFLSMNTILFKFPTSSRTTIRGMQMSPKWPFSFFLRTSVESKNCLVCFFFSPETRRGEACNHRPTDAQEAMPFRGKHRAEPRPGPCEFLFICSNVGALGAGMAVGPQGQALPLACGTSQRPILDGWGDPVGGWHGCWWCSVCSEVSSKLR